jgi:hypothetical protein
MYRLIPIGLAALSLAACSTVRETNTPRTATEEMLVSKAADEAAEMLTAKIPQHSRVFLDSSNFDALDGKYAIGTVQDALLRHGCRMADSKANSDVVVLLRSGASAIDSNETLIGLPPLSLPIPLAGAISTPKVALWDVERREGVAKFAITAVDAKTGELVASTGPNFGTSHVKDYTLLLFFSWRHQDIAPDSVDNK